MFNWHSLESLNQKPGICRIRDQWKRRSKSTALLLGTLILRGQQMGLLSPAHLAQGTWCYLSLGWARAWSLSHFPSQARGSDVSRSSPQTSPKVTTASISRFLQLGALTVGRYPTQLLRRYPVWHLPRQNKDSMRLKGIFRGQARNLVNGKGTRWGSRIADCCQGWTNLDNFLLVTGSDAS